MWWWNALFAASSHEETSDLLDIDDEVTINLVDQPDVLIQKEASFLDAKSLINFASVDKHNHKILADLKKKGLQVTLKNGLKTSFPEAVQTHQVDQISEYNNLNYLVDFLGVEKFASLMLKGQSQESKVNSDNLIDEYSEFFYDSSTSTLYVNLMTSFLMWNQTSGWSEFTVADAFDDFECFVTQVASGVFAYRNHHSYDIVIFKTGISSLENTDEEELKKLYVTNSDDNDFTVEDLDFTFPEPSIKKIWK